MFGLYRSRDIEKAAISAARLHALCFPKPWDNSYFSKIMDNPATTIFFARDEQEDIAFILLRKVEEEAEILTFCVSPAVQRQGIGSGLLWFAEKGLQQEGCTHFFLEVSDANIPARELYNKLNYKLFLSRPGYYADGSTALCLKKELLFSHPSPESVKGD